MRTKIGLGLMGGGIATLLLVAIAWPSSATPGVGVTSIVIGQGQAVQAAGIPILPGTDVVTVQNTFAPGGSSGWHSHPGPTVIVVQSGEITIYSESAGGGPCKVRTYQTGQAFYEWPRNVQTGVNEGGTNAVLAVTFFDVPHGGAARIDQPNPGNCPD